MQGNDGNLLITAFPTFFRNLMQKKKYSGVATISVNPARHTSSWVNASGEEDKNSDSSQCETDMQKAK